MTVSQLPAVNPPDCTTGRSFFKTCFHFWKTMGKRNTHVINSKKNTSHYLIIVYYIHLIFWHLKITSTHIINSPVTSNRFSKYLEHTAESSVGPVVSSLQSLKIVDTFFSPSRLQTCQGVFDVVLLLVGSISTRVSWLVGSFFLLVGWLTGWIISVTPPRFTIPKMMLWKMHLLPKMVSFWVYIYQRDNG